jgi:hypothetical protein
MSEGSTFRAAVIVALLVPGLASAAPIAGPCGGCGGGESCHLQQPIQANEDTHACCEMSAENAAPTTNLGSSSCECGRDAPPGVAADTRAPVETELAQTSGRETIDSDAPANVAFSYTASLAAPPPAPPAFLIACAFLT